MRHFWCLFLVCSLIGVTVPTDSGCASVPDTFDQLGIACRLSINVSVHDLRDGNLPELFRDTLRRTGAKARNIVVELTESVAVEEPARVRIILQQLQAMGIRTAIDDFGTGFSSLANLTELPFDEIKIDRLFVSQMMDSQSHRSAVRSVINMAHEMGMEVVAEGVADEEVLDDLRAKKCDRAQGYAISVPLSDSELIRFILNWRWESRSSGSVRTGARVIDFPDRASPLDAQSNRIRSKW